MHLSSRITDELRVLLQHCVSAKGYASNVGALVHIGQIQGQAEDAPATWVIPGPQELTQRYGPIAEIKRSFSVRAFADLRDVPSWGSASPAERELIEVELVDQIMYDMYRRLILWDELPSFAELVDDVSVGRSTPGYSEDGGTRVGAGVDLVVTYRVDPSDPSTPIAY